MGERCDDMFNNFKYSAAKPGCIKNHVILSCDHQKT